MKASSSTATNHVQTKATIKNIDLSLLDQPSKYVEIHEWENVNDLFVALLRERLAEFDVFIVSQLAKPAEDGDRIRAVFELTVNGHTDTITHSGMPFSVWRDGLRKWVKVYEEVIRLNDHMADRKARRHSDDS